MKLLSCVLNSKLTLQTSAQMTTILSEIFWCKLLLYLYGCNNKTNCLYLQLHVFIIYRNFSDTKLYIVITNIKIYIIY